MSARIDGAYYDEAQDGARLTTQLERVRHVLEDGRWHTVAAIAQLIDAPEPSVSAQIRNLRKEENGGYTIETKRAGGGLFVYRLVRGEER
ncbi:MAG: Rrf2 family transcriptional regulator [Methanomassiliicoccus sp.]|nr:Rrf2 family transcriptional regulator [Methanomassiliicoccus sp.]